VGNHLAGTWLILRRQGELLKNPKPNTLFAYKSFGAHKTFN
jgi:hypothetical protein